MPELKTAKDLEVWYSAALDKVHFAPDYDAIKTLIERIDRAETALAAANERIAELEQAGRYNSDYAKQRIESLVRKNEQLKSSMDGN